MQTQGGHHTARAGLSSSPGLSERSSPSASAPALPSDARADAGACERCGGAPCRAPRAALCPARGRRSRAAWQRSGQVSDRRSHWPRHCAWNACRQGRGSTRSPLSKSVRHTAHEAPCLRADSGTSAKRQAGRTECVSIRRMMLLTRKAWCVTTSAKPMWYTDAATTSRQRSSSMPSQGYQTRSPFLSLSRMSVRNKNRHQNSSTQAVR
mmetsp:Transcript_64408/g.201676  ORF Transcript_64408/g.201676 Transcript_64408/m.201676 type:complete len:209 (-) Transcript_64408:18-644(-)